jgi:hypothetical protein
VLTLRAHPHARKCQLPASPPAASEQPARSERHPVSRAGRPMMSGYGTRRASMSPRLARIVRRRTDERTCHAYRVELLTALLEGNQ